LCAGVSILGFLVRHTYESKGSALQESNMKSQHITAPSLTSVLGLVLMGLGLNGTTYPLSHLFCVVVGKALGLLPLVVLAAWQVLQPIALEHLGLVEFLYHCVSVSSLIEGLSRVL
jgi:hypothetical protein